MGSDSHDRRAVEDMFEDIELELASIRLVTERERLDQVRPPRRVAEVDQGIPARTIDSRGIDINKSSRVVATEHVERARAPISLAQRLALTRAEAAE